MAAENSSPQLGLGNRVDPCDLIPHALATRSSSLQVWWVNFIEFEPEMLKLKLASLVGQGQRI
jgi:hypothetical protein